MENSSNSAMTIVRTMDDAVRAGKILAASNYFKDVKSDAQAIAKVMAGVELGITPMAAITGVHIIEGKTALGSNLIAAQIQRSGRFKYRIKTQDAKACRIEFFEREGDKWESLGVSEFTIEMAKRAGLLELGQTWKKYSEAMLFARAISQGARLFTPAIFGGPIYTPEELDSITLDVPAEEVKAEPVKAEPAPAPEPAPADIDGPPTQEQLSELDSLILELPDDQAKAILEKAHTWSKRKMAANLVKIQAQVEKLKATKSVEKDPELTVANP